MFSQADRNKQIKTNTKKINFIILAKKNLESMGEFFLPNMNRIYVKKTIMDKAKLNQLFCILRFFLKAKRPPAIPAKAINKEEGSGV